MQESNRSLFKTNQLQTNQPEKQTVGLQPDSKMTRGNLETLLTSGMAHVQQQQWQSALDCYQQAVALQPSNEQTQFQLAIVLEHLGDKDSAIEHYFQALSLNPSLLSGAELCRFAEVLKQRDQRYRAMSCYQWALMQQQTSEIYSAIAEIWSTQAQYRLAEFHYQQAIALEPSWREYHNWGYVLSKLEQWEAAAQAYRQSIQLNPSFPWSHNNLGDMCVQLQQWDAAAAAYQRAIDLDPAFHWAYCNMGELYAKQGNFDKAMSYHQQSMVMRGWEQVVRKGYRFTHDWFTHNIPNWQEHLLPLANHQINALEIGSYEGMATCWLLDYILTHRTAKITCVDHGFQANFDGNIQKTGSPDKVTKIVGNSHEVLPTLVPESFDLIYVDGCHLADHAREDSFLSWKLLKPGGLMVLDDYEWSDPNCPGQDPKLGIDIFLAAVQSQIEILHKGYQIIVRKVLEK